ncbi:MAG: glyoxalase [Actinomycetota bacterium]
MAGDGFQLTSVTVGDHPSAWAAAGFEVHDGAVRIGSTVVICDPDAGRGIAHVAIDGVAADIDGLPIHPTDAPTLVEAPHANLVSGFDHLVAMSPAIARTADALLTAGLDRRRTRRFDVGGETRRQDFFWLGDVILELVGVDGVDGEGPATFWGLALECADLELAAARLGDALGTVKDAVQPGRRIATVRTRELGISVPIALMSPHDRA